MLDYSTMESQENTPGATHEVSRAHEGRAFATAISAGIGIAAGNIIGGPVLGIALGILNGAATHSVTQRK
jgi:hypothetical protein